MRFSAEENSPFFIHRKTSYSAPIKHCKSNRCWLNIWLMSLSVLHFRCWYPFAPQIIGDLLTVKKTKGFISNTFQYKFHINSSLDWAVWLMLWFVWWFFHYCFHWFHHPVQLPFIFLLLYLPWMNIRNCFQGIVKKHRCQIWLKRLFHHRLHLLGYWMKPIQFCRGSGLYLCLVAFLILFFP